MVLFEGMPYPIPVIYLKLAGEKEVVSLPFTEALAILTNVSFDYKTSKETSKEKGQVYYIITGDSEHGKNKTYMVSKADAIQRLQQDIYDNKSKIADMVIQPEDERLTEEVKQLMGM
jgi:hypothetical protein